MSSAGGGASAATRQVYHAFVTSGSQVSSQFFLGFLSRNGLLASDPRLAHLHETLGNLCAVEADIKLTLEQYDEATSQCSSLVHRAATGDLRVPSFDQVIEAVKEVYEKILPNKGGQNAQSVVFNLFGYIKQLAQVDPEQFSISVTSVDGQHVSIGDSDNDFCIQSCSKPISYLIAQDIYGSEYVHRHVGTEPSGRAFNDMCLKDVPTEKQPNRKIPHNPCINAGAIMAVSMVHPTLSRAERHERVLEVWRRLSGPNAPIGYDEDTYVSESADASRNWCLGYMMMHDESFPETVKDQTDLEDTLELYFMICSTLSTNRAMSIMASTLANGGLNPLSGERVFAAEQVQNVLPIMMMAGMYDYSGQWAFDVGVPAKSGVGGCVFVVVPNVCGISIWSPRLDKVGNSERGVKAATALGEIFQLNSFSVSSGMVRKKIDPRKRKHAEAQVQLGGLLFAAAEGDTKALNAEVEAGCDLKCSDYDARTALHLAASEGRTAAVKFIISKIGDDVNSVDRWGGTALDDAVHHNHEECAAAIKAAGGVENKALAAPAIGEKRSRAEGRYHEEAVSISKDEVISANAPMVLFAAAEGDVDQLVKFRASGVDLFVKDYDHRTALHLAASNGHAAAMAYLLAQAGANAKAVATVQDRWGTTPHGDTVREGKGECQALLEAVM